MVRKNDTKDDGLGHRMMVRSVMGGARVVQIRMNQPCTETVGGKTCHFRSKMEYRYARYLELLKTSGHIVDWNYERTKFVFPTEMTGAKQFLIDFDVLTIQGEIVHHEVKGYLDSRDITKLRRVAKHYPNARIHLAMGNIPRQAGKGSNRLRMAAKYTERVFSIADATRGLL